MCILLCFSFGRIFVQLSCLKNGYVLKTLLLELVG